MVLFDEHLGGSGGILKELCLDEEVTLTAPGARIAEIFVSTLMSKFSSVSSFAIAVALRARLLDFRETSFT